MTSATTSGPLSTSTSPADNEGEGEGPDVSVIVGAVVGSVVGVALLIAAVLIGIRLERKRAASGESGGFTKSLPRIHIVWPRLGEKKTATSHELEGGHHEGFTPVTIPKSFERYEMDASTDTSRHNG